MTLAGSAHAFADVITVDYSGHILDSFENVHLGSPQVPFSLVPKGSAFSGSITYHSQDPFFLNFLGEPFWAMSPGDGSTLTVNGFKLSFSPTSPGPQLTTLTAAQGGSHNDLFAVENGPLTGDLPNFLDSFLLVQFVWPEGTLTPNILPDPFNTKNLEFGLASSFSPFTFFQLSFFDANQDSFFVDGLIDNAQLASAVPEPSSWVLLTSVMALLGWRSVRRRRGPWGTTA